MFDYFSKTRYIINLKEVPVVFLLSTITNDTLRQLNEPRYEKTGFLHMRKQRRRSDAQ